MNKNVAGILSAAAVLTMLAGCTAYDRTKDQFVQPVVKDVKKGMSRAQVAQIITFGTLQARGVLRDVAVMVAGQFRGPEFDVRFGHAYGFRTAFVHVPEAAVDEYDRTVFR